MRLPLPPLDCHAHVETSINADALRSLRAVVVAVTRRPAEWGRALERQDQTTLWGVGVHPGVREALEEFDSDRFAATLSRALFVGEIGLDGRAKTDKVRQREVFDAILEVLASNPRPATIHSVGACDQVIAALRRHPIRAAVLHWWRGDDEQTKEGIDLGCYFSVNGHEVKKPQTVDLVPRDRLLTETDYPHSRRYDRGADRPGRVDAVEAALERSWNVDRLEVRRQLWHNFGAMLSETSTLERMPKSVLAALATAGFEG
jgi:TatD DNase family protein